MARGGRTPVDRRRTAPRGLGGTIAADPTADRRDRYGRLLAAVVLANGTVVNYRLVESGHARDDDSTFPRSERYDDAGADALAPGETATLYTGAGHEPKNEPYWGSTEGVWNTDGDAVIVAKEIGAFVRRYRY